MAVARRRTPSTAVDRDRTYANAGDRLKNLALDAACKPAVECYRRRRQTTTDARDRY